MAHSDETGRGTVSVPDIVEQPCGLYPAPEAFSHDYDAEDYSGWVEQSNGDPLPAPLVVYVQDGPDPAGSPDHTVDDAGAIERELTLQGALFDTDRPLQELICAGSIAARWTDAQLRRLVSAIQASFFIDRDSPNSWCVSAGEAALSPQRLQLLRLLGFNRIRYMPSGDADVAGITRRLSQAVNRAQELGFSKAIVDLRRMSGAEDARARAVEALLRAAQPQRLRLFACDGQVRDALDRQLAAAGYANIGMDWYLRASDEWRKALDEGVLHWTLLGYSLLKNPDVIGVGPGAMSSVCEFYGVNAASPADYARYLADGILPVVRGTELEDSDVLRREIVAMILGSFCIRVADIENKWGIEFERFFTCESELLRAFDRNKWVRWQDDRIEIVPRSFRELTEVCRVFDGGAANPPSRARHPASARSVPRPGCQTAS